MEHTALLCLYDNLDDLLCIFQDQFGFPDVTLDTLSHYPNVKNSRTVLHILCVCTELPNSRHKHCPACVKSPADHCGHQ